MTDETTYEGTAYIGVVGPEIEYGVARDSIHNILRRQGDAPPKFFRATKGYEARQTHLEHFYNKTHHDWCLLLDHDQVFEPDTLERLRSHGKSLISGYYMRRRYNPIYPVWFYYEDNMDWPRMPYYAPPEGDDLIKLGASGWGCMLVHRQVLDDMKPVLKGEHWVIEDDMDIFPYDLERLMEAVLGLEELVKDMPNARPFKAATKTYSEILSEEIRLLRGAKDPVGSDIRFPFFARLAGHDLWGDPTVRPTHLIYYELSPSDFETVPENIKAEFERQVKKKVEGGRKALNKERDRIRRAGQ
jgi:hypothetical protein